MCFQRAQLVLDEPVDVGTDLVVKLKYSRDRRRVISGIQRVSKPGRRVYVDRSSIPRVLGGMGIAFSDYHGTGANPAANAALTDAAFVAGRFRVVQHRRHV